LDFRLQNKVDNVPSNVLKKEEEFLKGVYVALPRGQRQDRPAVIPDAILGGNPLKLDRPNLRQLQDTMGGAGVFNFPLQGMKKLKFREVLKINRAFYVGRS